MHIRYRFTGHPFVDAGIAGMAALLEQDGTFIDAPEMITDGHARRACDLLCRLYSKRISKEEKFRDESTKRLPLCTHLLQEVIPGSSWDQAKGKPDNQISIFEKYVKELLDKAASPPIGTCFLTGTDAHLRVGKSAMPLLSSGSERPNCYPNLSDGYEASAWVAIAVLFSPLSIEKTAKWEGGGSACLIYHSGNWRFMVGVAQLNLRRIETLLAANSIEAFLSSRYKHKQRSGTWKMALSTILHTLNRIDETERPEVAVWSFNANNQSCRYECTKISDAVLVVHANRRTHTSAYRDIPRSSDLVARLILEGRPIASASISEAEAKKGPKDADRLSRTVLQPGWALQRLYAEKVLKMPMRLLNAVELAAEQLTSDADAVRYVVYEKRIRPIELAGRYKLSREWCAVFADYPGLWRDYLRAAVLWKAKGHDFGKHLTVSDEPGGVGALIKDVAVRLREKHGFRRLAMKLSARVPYGYRSSWINLLNDGACTWEDFNAFNPLDEALSVGGFFQTRTRRDYLVAYLLSCAHAPGQESAEELEHIGDILPEDTQFQFNDEEEG